MRTQKCEYCTKEVKVSRKGHLLSHLNGAKQCLGTGFTAAHMERRESLKERIREDGRAK